jgi:hypothetical protein
MPPLANARYEQFANDIANGVPPLQAYPSAGFKYNTGNAYRLSNDERIVKRVNELRNEKAAMLKERVERAVEEQGLTVESLLKDAAKIQELAIKDGAYGPATSALKERGVLSGLRVERAAVKAQHEVTVSELTDDEILEEMIGFILHRAEQLGLDPEQCTLAQYLEAWQESHAAMKARDVTPELHRRAPPPRPTRLVQRPDFKPKPSGAYGGPADATSFDNRRR